MHSVFSAAWMAATRRHQYVNALMLYNDCMKTLTVRNLPRQLAEALNRERRRSDRSLNQTVIDVLSRGLGIGDDGPRRNGLAKLAGTWTDDDLQQFNESVAALEVVDPEMWAE